MITLATRLFVCLVALASVTHGATLAGWTEYRSAYAGYQLRYPSAWLVQDEDRAGVTLQKCARTWRARYVGKGCAEIFIRADEYGGSRDVNDYLGGFLPLGERVTLVHGDDNHVARAEFIHHDDARGGDKEIYLAFRRARRMFLVALTYNADDHRSSQYQRILAELVNSIAVIGGTSPAVRRQCDLSGG